MANDKRGFASMDPKKQKEIAAEGGRNSSLSHDQAVEIGRKGGKAQHNQRGLQAADEKTRQRVASAGGRARGNQQDE